MVNDTGYVWKDRFISTGLKEQHFPVVDFFLSYRIKIYRKWLKSYKYSKALCISIGPTNFLKFYLQEAAYTYV